MSKCNIKSVVNASLKEYPLVCRRTYVRMYEHSKLFGEMSELYLDIASLRNSLKSYLKSNQFILVTDRDEKLLTLSLFIGEFQGLCSIPHYKM